MMIGFSINEELTMKRSDEQQRRFFSKVREDFGMKNLFKRESAILVRGGQ
jgi:hypothetical protein